MVMEPMADSSEGVREGIERGKFRSGLKSKRQNTGTLKRKRDDVEESGGIDGIPEGSANAPTNGAVSGAMDPDRAVKKRKVRGPKGPNPLSIKKPKARKISENDDAEGAEGATQADPASVEESTYIDTVDIVTTSTDGVTTAPSKRRRKRKHKVLGTNDLKTDVEVTSEA